MNITACHGGLSLGDLPVVQHRSVFHVGTMQASDRAALSYEGDGLSVSVHPGDWARIARLNGSTWELQHHNADQMSFLDAHALSEEQRNAILAWGLKQGWVKKTTRWEIPDFDENDNIVGSFSFSDYAEALTELENSERDEILPQASECLMATSSFPVGRMDPCNPLDGLLVAFVDHYSDLDGVWWNDAHDPARYSCPRGVLVRDLQRVAMKKA